MTMPSTVDVVEVTPADDTKSYVDWSAIIAGIVLASAISILLLAFGSAVGLGFTDFNARDDASPIWIAIAAASWLLWVQISSFMAGGYLTGRLRRRHHDATEDESDVRDGAHGILVWAGALVVGAILAVSGIGAVANVVGSTAATVTNAAAEAAGPAAADAIDPNAYFVDMLFRPATGAADDDAAATEAEATPEAAPAATTEAAPATGTPATGTTTTPATGTTPAASTTPAAQPTTPAASIEPAASAPARDPEMVRGEATRIFARAATGELPDTDRTYLAQLVADSTSLSDEEAAARVDEVVTAIDTAKAEAVEVAETARKTGVIGAFLIAASLLVSAIGAFWAAQKGGNHRDKGTAFPDVFRRF